MYRISPNKSALHDNRGVRSKRPNSKMVQAKTAQLQNGPGQYGPIPKWSRIKRPTNVDILTA